MHNLELHERVAQIYSYPKLMIGMVFAPGLIDERIYIYYYYYYYYDYY